VGDCCGLIAGFLASLVMRGGVAYGIVGDIIVAISVPLSVAGSSAC